MGHGKEGGQRSEVGGQQTGVNFEFRIANFEIKDCLLAT